MGNVGNVGTLTTNLSNAVDRSDVWDGGAAPAVVVAGTRGFGPAPAPRAEADGLRDIEFSMKPPIQRDPSFFNPTGSWGVGDTANLAGSAINFAGQYGPTIIDQGALDIGKGVRDIQKGIDDTSVVINSVYDAGAASRKFLDSAISSLPTSSFQQSAPLETDGQSILIDHPDVVQSGTGSDEVQSNRNYIAQGNVDLGNATSDTITATGRFDSPLVPSTDSARDLGTTSLYWANAYVDAITTTGNINAGGMISGSFISSSRDIHIKDLAVSASIASLSAASGESNESSFKTIQISTNMGASPVVADSDADTLAFAEGAGMAISTNAGTDQITFAVDGVLEALDTFGAASANGEFIVATGAGAFAYESGNTARTSLGLGTTDAPTFATVNTGQGANELYAMNQNVRTSDSPTFASLTLSGDLVVEGDTTTLSTTNLTVEDRFVFIATGSAGANVDGGIVVQSGSSADTGSAIYHDSNSQRWAVAKTVKSEATAVNPLQFVTTATVDQQNPGSGDGHYGIGEMWVNYQDEDVWIRTS